MKKSVLSTAVMTAMGVAAGLATTTVSTTASAATITGFTIADVGSNTMGSGGFSSTLDQLGTSFQFSGAYTNAKSYVNTTQFIGDGSSGDGSIKTGPGANPTGSFSTGFLFSSAPFVPFTFGSGLNGTATPGVNHSLSITTLDFGGLFGKGGTNPGTNFLLNPDTNFPLQILWSKASGPTDWKAAMRWGHVITTAEDATGNFTGFSAQWTLEGCATTNVGGVASASCTGASAVPVPAAVWLFGSGLVGLAGVARRRKTQA